MPVIHFKSRSSLMFWATLWTIAGTIYIIANGANLLVIAFWIILNIIIVCLGTRPGPTANAKSTKKTVEESTSLDQIRYAIRTKSSLIAEKLNADNNNTLITINAMLGATVMVDYYYEALKASNNAFGSDSHRFDDLGADVVERESLQNKIITNFFGAAFGIFLYKAIENNSYKVNKSALKKFLNNSRLTDGEQKALYERAVDALSAFKNNELEYPMNHLGKASVSFIGAELKKGDIADPPYVMAAKAAFLAGYNNMDVNEKIVEAVKQAHLIK